MPTAFSDEVVSAILRHMNDDHTDDNLLIVRAFGAPDATAATMTGLDGDGGDWRVEQPDAEPAKLRVPWPSGSITERPEVRREVVALYDAACARLGVEPRPH
ncbi:hypothetical protein GCM10025768_03330 [Microbacterium pseudoresistens]|uniref:DUF2470 domain-containing protein n=1 Tax=Microbacterium pseudoresistens TaxID=640634 RepID=A0A7Y9EUR8_9MICO|nr:DUF2470 domain-containing protein [Microbacterium pseudoresistens]NYD54169.1 hypothetical protein [Microbacterium pseudoresistens]